MAKISTSDFKKGIFIEFKGEPNQIIEFQFVNPGKGSAFVRTKLKNLASGKVQEFTYKSGETVEEVPIMTREMQYLYKSGENYIFMDKNTYEQMTINKNIIGDFYRFLRESELYQLLILEDKVIGMRYPKKIRLIVINADEAVRGNTVMGAKKIIELETGVKIAAPLFIKKGDLIVIDPISGEYIERASKDDKT